MRTSANLTDLSFDQIVVPRTNIDAHSHDSNDLQATGGRITVPDAHLLFAGHFERSGDNLILTGDGQKFVVSNYFKNANHSDLFSPDGASLSGKVVDALTGHNAYAQASPAPGNANPIGHVAKLTGSASVIRNGVSVELNIGDNVFKSDVLQSGPDSALGISFADGTAFSLSSNARMVLNEMVYDPGGSSNSTFLSLVQGTITFVAGQIAKSGNMRVDTPVATMGIRGTAVLVEIAADNGPTKFSVLTEPGNVTGSFVLYDKLSGAPLGSVSQAGQVTLVTPGGTGQPTLSQQLKTTQDLQSERDIVRQVFSIAFPTFNFDDTGHRKFGSVGSGTTPFPDSGFYPFPPGTLPGILTALGITTTAEAMKFADLIPIFPSTTVNTPPQITVTSASTFQSGGVGNVEDTQSSTPGNKTFSTADHVTINDPNVGVPPFFDVAIPYVPGTGKVVSAIGPASIPASFNLLNLVSIDPATGIVTYDPSTFRFLGANEKAVFIIAFDAKSGPDTVHETLQFTVKGLDDAPEFAFSNVSVSLSELAGHTGSSNPNTQTILIPFQDVDFSDSASGYAVSIVHASATGVTSGLPHDAAALDAALRSFLSVQSISKDVGSSNGVITEHFSAPDKTFDYLAAGETVDLVYTLNVTDAFGATGTETVTVKVTGTNDAPVLTADVGVHTIVKQADAGTSHAVQDVACGSLQFTDVDLTDTHQASVCLIADKVVCPDGVVPAATLLALQTAMTAHIAAGIANGVDDPDSTGSGSGTLKWDFAIPDHLLDFLRDGQTLTLTYDITVTDYHDGVPTGTSSKQPVTLVVTGTDDAPQILSATNPSAQTVETYHHETVIAPLTGTVTASDADIGDTLTASVTGDASVTFNGSTTLPCDADVASLVAASAVTFDSATTNGGASTLHWVYDPGTVNLDFLKCGDTLTIDYTAQVNDGHGNTGSQELTITLVGGHGTSVVAQGPDTFIFPQQTGSQSDTGFHAGNAPHYDVASLFPPSGPDLVHNWPADDHSANHQQAHDPVAQFNANDPMHHDASHAKNVAHLAANDYIIHPGFG
ncbi:MAG: hypothetical protein BGP05_02105 [Rhizobiales bacterium 62-47]|nr:FecR domain-containing protein [Hyphomicrobiales bacterium]OJY12755.1 MAG: hypothetical protein BGP05_02105 [Rhizobiales bacterium 62-47]